MQDLRETLDPAKLRLYAPMLNLSGIHLDALLDAAAQVCADPALLSQVEAHRFATFETDTPWDRTLPAGAPSLYPALVLLAQLPALRQFYRERGISDDVLADTLHDFGLWIAHAYNHGQGHTLGEFNWLTHHFSGKLFRLGRLQFVAVKGHTPAWMYRSRQTGRLVLLAPEGAQYKPSGWAQDTFRVHEENVWTAHLRQDGCQVTGYPLLHDGRADSQPVTLDLEDYQLLYQPGDLVLDMHIPTGMPLDLEACRASLRRAPAFYSHHFPELHPTAFQCESWLLGPCLEEMLPPESNIVRFGRLFARATAPGRNDGQFWERIFDFTPVTPETAPRDTYLRRAFLDRLSAGLPICTSCGLIPLDGPSPA